MFLHKFFLDLSTRLEFPYYSIHNGAPFRELPDPIVENFVMGPQRSFPTPDEKFDTNLDVQHLVQVRDPRDILVSEYFSLGWIHSDKDWNASDQKRRQTIREMSIDQYVLKQDKINPYPLWERYRPILSLSRQPDITIVRYEDMVNQFDRWLLPVLQLLELEPINRWQKTLQGHYRDEFQPGESPGSHKRNVAPGDHRSKLLPETIAILNQQFEPVLSLLNY